jgi:RNA polymerase sigma-70 factor (ECF subfamily)
MSEAMTAPLPDSLPTRYSLLSRLQNWDDQESWKDFFDTYWRLIYSIAIKSGLTETEAQDVVQETIISVAKDIHKFKRDRTLGSFKGWLRNLTRWRIADHLRKQGRLGAERALVSWDTAGGAELSEIPDPAGDAFTAAWEEDWQANLFTAAVERIKRKVREEHYQIFDLHVLRYWPAGKVAETLDINIAQVYLAKHRITALLRKEIRELEKRW